MVTKEEAVEIELPEVDMSVFEPLIGVPYGGIQVKYPFTVNDFRRWVTHTDNFNPLHFDDDWATDSRFGQIVAPQSFQAIRSIGEDLWKTSTQALGAYHVGEEIFFYGPRTYEGDKFIIDRSVSSYRKTKTRYGPSVFFAIDITYTSERGGIMKKRATTLAHDAGNGAKLGHEPSAQEIAGMSAEEPDWTEEQIEQIEDQKLEYIKSWRTHDKRLFGSVKVGDKLTRNVIGPHSGQSFVYSDGCDMQDVWGMIWIPPDQPPLLLQKSAAQAAGQDAERVFKRQTDPVRRELMPARRGYPQLSNSHDFNKAAMRRGMPRAFVAGTMETIWGVDYLTNWAGEWGFLRRSNIRYNAPVLSGDLTYIDGVVTGLGAGPEGYGTVYVDYTLEAQNGLRQCIGSGEIELPLA